MYSPLRVFLFCVYDIIGVALASRNIRIMRILGLVKMDSLESLFPRIGRLEATRPQNTRALRSTAGQNTVKYCYTDASRVPLMTTHRVLWPVPRGLWNQPRSAPKACPSWWLGSFKKDHTLYWAFFTPHPMPLRFLLDVRLPMEFDALKTSEGSSGFGSLTHKGHNASIFVVTILCFACV